MQLRKTPSKTDSAFYLLNVKLQFSCPCFGLRIVNDKGRYHARRRWRAHNRLGSIWERGCAPLASSMMRRLWLNAEPYNRALFLSQQRLNEMLSRDLPSASAPPL